MPTEDTAISYELLPQCDHPVDDKNLPSYQDGCYQWVTPRLNEAHEHWIGDECWKIDGRVTDTAIAKKHLPQQEAEDDTAYNARVLQSPWPDFLKSAIKGFAGLLSDLVQGASIAPQIADLLSDVDLQGSSIETFMRDCDERAYRDGALGIFIEHSPAGESAGRPYLVSVDRCDLIKLRGGFVAGKFGFTLVVCREQHSIPDGLYGELTATRYRVYTPGRSELYDLVKVSDGSIQAVLAEEPTLHTAVGKPLSTVPFVLYSLSSAAKDAARAELPFKPLHRLQDIVFQLESSKIAVIFKCNIPVPWRAGLVHEGQTDFSNVGPMLIGTGFGMDFPINGGLFYTEPTGSAIAGTRQAIQDCEASALRYSLEFLSGQSTNTATEADLRSTQAKSNLAFAATQKESALQEILDIWAQYLGITKTAADDEEARGGTITVSRDIMKAAMDANFINALSALVDKNQLSLATLLSLLSDGRVLRRDFSVGDELEAIVAQKEAAMQSAIAAVSGQAMASSVYPGVEDDEGGT